MSLPLQNGRDEFLIHTKKIFQKRRSINLNNKIIYSHEERIMALQLIEMGYSRKTVAFELGISMSAITLWKNDKSLKTVVKTEPFPRCLTVVKTKDIDVISPNNKASQTEFCEITIKNSINIRINILAVDARFLKEIAKAVVEC